MFRHLCLALCLAAPPAAGAAVFEGPIRVIDGDTFDVGDIRVRLHGVDAPERDQTCNAPGAAGWSCGAWVTGEVRTRYEGRIATCETRDTDRYGRTVAACSVGGTDMAQALVEDGLLFAYERYSTAYVAAEKAAQIAGRGLHAVGVQEPARHRQAARQAAAPERAAPAGWRRLIPSGLRSECTIKGNISRSGERIYHMPGQENYADTRITTGKGERWFCTEAEARAAGWRRARR